MRVSPRCAAARRWRSPPPRSRGAWHQDAHATLGHVGNGAREPEKGLRDQRVEGGDGRDGQEVRAGALVLQERKARRRCLGEWEDDCARCGDGSGLRVLCGYCHRPAASRPDPPTPTRRGRDARRGTRHATEPARLICRAADARIAAASVRRERLAAVRSPATGTAARGHYTRAPRSTQNLIQCHGENGEHTTHNARRATPPLKFSPSPTRRAYY